MGNLYRVHNGPMQTTAAPAKVATGATIKTMLQVATPALGSYRLKSWGISFDASALAVPIQCELIETDVAATVTAYVNADVMKIDDPLGSNSNVTLGTAASGYTASAEGTITAVREADLQLISPTAQFIYQWVLGDEFAMQASRFLRIRVTAPVTVNASCWVQWRE